MNKKAYWIKERFNPQMKKPYYVAMGQLSNREASKNESPLYGANIMLRYETKEDYEAKLADLKDQGERVQ